MLTVIIGKVIAKIKIRKSIVKCFLTRSLLKSEHNWLLTTHFILAKTGFRLHFDDAG